MTQSLDKSRASASAAARAYLSGQSVTRITRANPAPARRMTINEVAHFHNASVPLTKKYISFLKAGKPLPSSQPSRAAVNSTSLSAAPPASAAASAASAAPVASAAPSRTHATAEASNSISGRDRRRLISVTSTTEFKNIRPLPTDGVDAPVFEIIQTTRIKISSRAFRQFLGEYYETKRERPEDRSQDVGEGSADVPHDVFSGFIQVGDVKIKLPNSGQTIETSLT